MHVLLDLQAHEYEAENERQRQESVELLAVVFLERMVGNRDRHAAAQKNCGVDRRYP